MAQLSLISKKRFAEFMALPETKKKMNESIIVFLDLFSDLGKKYNDEPAQSFFISTVISILLKSCNAKKSEVEPMLKLIIEKTLKD